MQKWEKSITSNIFKSFLWLIKKKKKKSRGPVLINYLKIDEAKVGDASNEAAVYSF